MPNGLYITRQYTGIQQSSGGGGPSYPQGSLFNEDFRTGYENAGGSVTGSPIAGSTPPGSPPSGLPATSLHFAPTTAIYQWLYTLAGDHTETLYHRFWVYIASDGLTDGSNDVLYRLEDSGGTMAAQVVWFCNGSQRQIFGQGTSSSTAINVNAATWYRIITKHVNNGTCQISVYNSAGTQVGSTQTFSADTTAFRRFKIGGVSAATIDGDIIGLGIDATGALNP